MASQQELQSSANAARTAAPLDPQSFFQTNGSASAFPSMMSSSQVDSTVTATSVTHVNPQMTTLYQSDMDPTHAISLPHELSLGNLPSRSLDVSAMDVVSAASADAAAAHGLLTNYSSQNTSFTLDHINGLDAVDVARLASSPSATTVSTNPSHASSPAVNGMAPSFSTTPSSLVSALNGVEARRSRTESSGSPPDLLSSGSELGFSTTSSGPATSSLDPGFPYPPYDAARHAKEDSPEQGGSPHLFTLGTMLKNIARTASSASKACDMGSTTDAQQIVDELKRNVLLVAELVSQVKLADASVTVPAVPGLDVEQHQPLNTLSLFPPSTPLDPSAMYDTSDLSRKRGASSMDGDRAMKAMKLEPQDEPQPVSTAPVRRLSTSTHTSSGFAFTPSTIPPPSMSSLGDISSIPPSLSSNGSSSRPQSSAGIPPHPLALASDPPNSSHPLQAGVQYPTMDNPQGLVGSSTEYVSPATSSVPSTALPSTGFNPSLPGSMWRDPQGSLTHHHQHSLSAGAVLVRIPESGMSAAGPSSLQFPPPPAFHSPIRATMLSHQQSIPMPSSSSVSLISHPSVRSSRSSSFAHQQGEMPNLPYDILQARQAAALRSRASSPALDDEMDGQDSDDELGDLSYSQYHSPSAGAEGADAVVGAEGPSASVQPPRGGQRRMSRGSPSAEGGSTSSGHANEVPQEYRAEVERIFFEFLNMICSNLEATDAKGEPIHQTLMAKKMQRLDESPDFRPFKFRIQAFTNAFLEELSRQGYPEEKIPMKKIRNFLWSQPYISRFNEDGKKSKSKGNHIWHVDGKKTESGWMFRPFRRRLAGTPPGVAYVGLRWSWAPRIWDPQASRANMPVKYSSPSLPSWLSWKDDVLSGIPTPDAQNCDVTVEARFVQDGTEEFLSHTVHVTIAPMASVDSTFTPSRRPSLVGDIQNPRRVLSDTAVVAQCNPPRIMRTQTTMAPVAPVVAPDSQVVQVLTTAAQRVAQEAQSQVVASPNEVGPELQALAKQQHVLTVTAQAINTKMAAEAQEGTSQSNALTAAAQQVVLQAARQVAADRSVAAVSAGIPPSQNSAPQVTVKDVSVATQSAVAQAVDMVGPLSSEVDVLMTASSLLQQQTQQTQQTRPPVPLVMESQLAALDASRAHTTGTTPPHYGMSIPPTSLPVFYSMS
ncbi:uncharacterized protein B0H18DRAFT_485663 [Fomitopsis serialis]|uniref:uncharacterized protein n=1 Tax=Fomitopsis serialis TaxID=139415 RepID=UPI0020080D7C|nr:uncharacterized protein B0H18DRAFT_485663 [Neoantrodia serialis]KAH9934724.1 hypothetical protein B0H18DRAFT_485663 [Neoantrodia serialis]